MRRPRHDLCATSQRPTRETASKDKCEKRSQYATSASNAVLTLLLLHGTTQFQGLGSDTSVAPVCVARLAEALYLKQITSSARSASSISAHTQLDEETDHDTLHGGRRSSSCRNRTRSRLASADFRGSSEMLDPPHRAHGSGIRTRSS